MRFLPKNTRVLYGEQQKGYTMKKFIKLIHTRIQGDLTSDCQDEAPLHPGEILKIHYAEPLNLTLWDLAEALLLPYSTVVYFTSIHGVISPDIALRLARAFGTTPELWMNLQRDYDLWQAKHATSEWQRVAPLSHGAGYWIVREYHDNRKSIRDTDIDE